jgi:hypothetical protein
MAFYNDLVQVDLQTGGPILQPASSRGVNTVQGYLVL